VPYISSIGAKTLISKTLKVVSLLSGMMVQLAVRKSTNIERKNRLIPNYKNNLLLWLKRLRNRVWLSEVFCACHYSNL